MFILYSWRRQERNLQPSVAQRSGRKTITDTISRACSEAALNHDCVIHVDVLVTKHLHPLVDLATNPNNHTNRSDLFCGGRSVAGHPWRRHETLARNGWSRLPAAREEHPLRTRSMGKYPTWLAMAAICLIVAAPVVSQILASHASVGEMGLCGSQMAHMGHEHAPDEQQPHPDPMAFCGYCTLFHHTSVLPSVPWQPNLRGPLPWRLLVAPAVPSPFVAPLLSAAPRGPPVSVQV